ncbi:MAG: AAA family ATPase [Verrucomicrobia bacterium]|nr:AAA family ATPase [Verrucomicrobiota bacterium]
MKVKEAAMAHEKNRISGIKVGGFKSISTEQRIEIRPLTILAGANSSGKSSFMQPLLLLKQTLEAPGDPGALLLDGQNVRFTSTDQLVSKLAGKDLSPGFRVCLDLLERESLEMTFRREEGRGFELDRMIYTAANERIEMAPNMSHDDILQILPQPWKSFHQDLAKREKGPLHWTVSRQRCFLSFGLSSDQEPRRQITFGPYGVLPSQAFIPYIQGVIHLPGLRGNPRRTYPKTAGGPYFQGTFEMYVASVIARWQTENDGKLETLGKALEEMELTWKVKAVPVDDTQVELRVGRLVHSKRGGAHDLVSIADVGFGVSQSLPVVVALLAAQSGQLVYLEQPEIHLHPLAQRRLAGVLCDAVKRGVVVVVETHSALLLREIQTFVATDRMDRKNIKLHWFQRAEDGSTTATAADLDERGAYGNWPEDFDRTELEAEKAYLDAAEIKG